VDPILSGAVLQRFAPLNCCNLWGWTSEFQKIDIVRSELVSNCTLRRKTPKTRREGNNVPSFLRIGDIQVLFIIWRKQLLLFQRVENSQYELYKYTYLWRHNFYNNTNFKKSLRHVWHLDVRWIMANFSITNAVYCLSLGFSLFKSRGLPNTVVTRNCGNKCG